MAVFSLKYFNNQCEAREIKDIKNTWVINMYPKFR